MKPIDQAGSKLLWRQPSALTRSYELVDDGVPVATLDWEKTLGSLARARTASGSWTLKRSGFLRPVVTCRVDPEVEAEAATFHPTWTGDGTIRLPDGRGFELTYENFWRTRCRITAPGARGIASFEMNHGLVRLQSTVTLEDRELSSDVLVLLVVLGWYVVVLTMQDTVAIVASTS